MLGELKVVGEDAKLSWQGLIPGASRLEDVIARLGAPSDKGTLTNGDYYEFDKGAVIVFFLNQSNLLSKLRITSYVSQPGTLPQSIIEAREYFGPLTETRIDKLEGAIFERPGVRVACDTFGDPALVRWIELYV